MLTPCCMENGQKGVKKDVPKTWNNFSPNLSSLKDLYGAVRTNFPKWGSKEFKINDFRKKYFKNKNKILPHCLPFQFRPMVYACT